MSKLSPEEARERRRLSKIKYRQSAKGQAKLKEYSRSEAFKKTNAKYRNSPKGQLNARRSQDRYKAKLQTNMECAEQHRAAARLRQARWATTDIGQTRLREYREAEWRKASARKYIESDKGKNTRSTSSNRRRALEANVHSDGIPNSAVFDRDGYECRGCGLDTSQFTDCRLRRPTVDHIVPLSQGGHDTLDNKTVLCHRCNCVKSNRMTLDELRAYLRVA